MSQTYSNVDTSRRDPDTLPQSTSFRHHSSNSEALAKRGLGILLSGVKRQQPTSLAQRHPRRRPSPVTSTTLSLETPCPVRPPPWTSCFRQEHQAGEVVKNTFMLSAVSARVAAAAFSVAALYSRSPTLFTGCLLECQPGHRKLWSRECIFSASQRNLRISHQVVRTLLWGAARVPPVCRSAGECSRLRTRWQAAEAVSKPLRANSW